VTDSVVIELEGPSWLALKVIAGHVLGAVPP
jgi:hypothetical protein